MQYSRSAVLIATTQISYTPMAYLIICCVCLCDYKILWEPLLYYWRLVRRTHKGDPQCEVFLWNHPNQSVLKAILLACKIWCILSRKASHVQLVGRHHELGQNRKKYFILCIHILRSKIVISNTGLIIHCHALTQTILSASGCSRCRQLISRHDINYIWITCLGLRERVHCQRHERKMSQVWIMFLAGFRVGIEPEEPEVESSATHWAVAYLQSKK